MLLLLRVNKPIWPEVQQLPPAVAAAAAAAADCNSADGDREDTTVANHGWKQYAAVAK